MKRPLKPDEQRIWGMVAATVHPLPGRATPKAPAISDSIPAPLRDGGPIRPSAASAPKAAAASVGVKKPVAPKDPIEPRRKHRIVRERDPIGARLDLHGLTHDRARAALEAFLRRAWDEGLRAVLVITGKGVQGDGVLRRAAPEWLAAPHLGHMVAGIAEAHRRHGGEGALYVALKRKPRT